MGRSKKPTPSPEQQVELRALLERLRSGLYGKAVLLVRRLREPKPHPEEIVNETMRRVLGRYTDADVTSASGLAFVTLTNIVCDIARRRKRYDGGFIDDDTTVPDEAPREPDPIVQKAFAKLEPREQCVLARVAIEEYAVAKAFELCNWKTPSPHPEYRKILKKFREKLEEVA